MLKSKEFLTTKEAADYLGISLGNLNNHLTVSKYDILKNKVIWKKGRKYFDIKDLLEIKRRAMKTKNFLTYEEAIERANDCFWHSEGVYRYEKDGKYTLIEKGKVLVEGVDCCNWYSEGVYKYQKDGKCTLIEKGKILVEVEGVDCCNWYSEGVYKYQKDGKWTKINKKENNGN